MTEPILIRPLQPFTVSMDYFATGEGVTVAVLVLNAHNNEEAKNAFLDANGYYGSSREYFGRGVDIHEGVNRELLGRWLAPRFIDALERRMQVRARFMLNWHFNAS
ncbi:hypothetical protein E7T06_09340 [Deinococcus sp. Arct2-2]|uniref:hypothetical protein n=1 Tax=Deinococcus sp. Arct2-2 TaxID=2568653 RepID=UPI0010A4CD81|nr:hypothetical protein [Deinococcus sp. Arct2-2]THF69953.1 hypothetical protein E7T06_09340 [Deinococcus sp. Arct2-2]